MAGIKYYLRRLTHLNQSKMKKTVSRIREKSGKRAVPLAFDMLWCALRYGCGYTDYEFSEWWTLDGKQRKTYLTRGINDSLVKKLNDQSLNHLLENKDETFSLFPEYMKRGHMLVTRENKADFIKYASEHADFIVKPRDDTCGHGVRRLAPADYENADLLYEDVIKDGDALVEDRIIQHHEMSRLCPDSVNTVRLVTVISDLGVPSVLYAAVRIGRGGSVVDNLTAGGLTAPVDVETGKINGFAYGRDCSVHTEHPDTGLTFLGFEIPFWEKVKEAVLGSAKKIPGLRYVGWDVAVTGDGPTFVEVNEHPGYGFVQFPANTPGKTGVLPDFRKAMKG
ncbi:MAG: hypothetical protein J6Z80_04125 [Clostridia bacterium]|nr:hypothetical protein [Clostridia bacterium]